jgi:hypothetical protein
MTENNAKSIVELFADRNSGKMVSEIATKEKELEMLREIISLRKTVHGLVESLSEVQKKAKDDLEAAESLGREKYERTMDRVCSVLYRDYSLIGHENYALVRMNRDGRIEYGFTFDGHHLWNWIRDWEGSERYEDIPDELEGFRNSFFEELRADETMRAIVLGDEAEPVCMDEAGVPTGDEAEPVCMDEAGVPTTFTRMCSICGEEGRNSRTHKEDPIEVNGRLTYHWI